MTKPEMAKIFALFQLSYPRAEEFRGENLVSIITLWAGLTEDISFADGQLAAKNIIKTSQYPPSIALFREEAGKVAQARVQTMQVAWKGWEMALLAADFDKAKAYELLPLAHPVRGLIDAVGVDYVSYTALSELASKKRKELTG